MMDRKLFKSAKILFLIVGCLLFASTDLAIGEDPDYPSKPVNFIIAMGPGGTTDLSYRAFIDAANKHFGQRIVPVNKPGGGGTIGAMVVASANPDGYTIGGGTTANVLVAPFSPDSPYKNLDAFTLIMNFGKYVYPLIVGGDAPWRTYKELVDWARQNPGGIKAGIVGAKSVATLGLILSQVEKREKIKFSYVSFKAMPEILTATLGGHIHLYASGTNETLVSYLKEGKLRLLAFADLKIEGFENYPSLADLYGWETTPNLHAVWGPKGLPDSIIKKLEEAFAQAVRDPDFIKIMNRLYMPIVYMNRSEVNVFVNKALKEVEKTAKELQAEKPN